MVPPPHIAKRLPVGPSLLLDAIRFGAALMVAVGHVSLAFFGTGLPNLSGYASGAVGVFFVLSGFVIRYVTLGRVSTLRKFAIDRASRMYSVVLPALAITVLLDAGSRFLNPKAYLGLLGWEWNHGAVCTGLSLIFLSQSWFLELQPLSNGAYWSICYEVAYYAAYGSVFYLAGRKRIGGLVLVFLLFGPAVFLLFPTWLLGCLTFDIYASGRFTKRTAAQFASLCLLCVAIAVGSTVGVHHLRITDHLIGKTRIVMALFAVPTAVLMLLGCRLLDTVRLEESSLIVRTIRRVSEATFTLYLIHLPIFILVGCIVAYGRNSAVFHLEEVAGVVLLSIWLARIFDQWKESMRKLLTAWCPERNHPDGALRPGVDV